MTLCMCSAVKAGKFPLAAAQYTAALVACANAGSPAYAAVLHSNRAAALQSQCHYAEAMADCLRSRSLDPRFTKATARLPLSLLNSVPAFDTLLSCLSDAQQHPFPDNDSTICHSNSAWRLLSSTSCRGHAWYAFLLLLGNALRITASSL